MARWAAGVEYDGGVYAGWQAQPDRVSVQATVEQALSSVAAHPVAVQAAGRTDAGVHALGQVIHFDSGAPRAPHAWLLGANSRLPQDISLRWVRPVPEDFHARYSALARRYRYLIHNQRARSALLTGRSARVALALDERRMHAAAQTLLGEHDFSAFRAAECQARSPWRELQAIGVRRRGACVMLDICGNAFLHHMVRNIAGALIEVGLGRKPVEWIAWLLASRDRRQGAATAAAAGLYLLGVDYPARYALPATDDVTLP
ncbi:MAG: tRNA pseudouridine(38-40) synthase TruA [Gammaproteobacteria bacterium]|nr:tRNA pseudouridine(38-40) synthase TruA [Gammaproteobacteria bacterium]